FEDALQNLLDTATTARERLTRYMDFFAASMNSGLLPLCGALAAEKSALPSRLQDRVRYFFELHLKWLSGVVSAGIRTNELRSDLEVDASSRLILSTIEGASLVAWATGDTSVVQSTKNQVLRDIQLQGSSCPI
ncbi:MAG: TetR/AcrR family transcriptional regulator, partial [Pseudomonadota bacterium]